jgi:c-di-GMP-binding flagellar brake protein YcgR
MDGLEEISGEKLLELFNRIKQERTILRLHLLGKDFERLTIITGLERKNDETYLAIDSPKDLGDHLTEDKGGRLFFEFTDKKKIHYSFKTNLKDLAGNNALVHLPQSVNRLQRRKNFRINTPIGTRLNLKIRGKAFSLAVINLSQNGILIQQTGENHSDKVFFKGLVLKRLDLVCPKRGKEEHLLIQQAVIQRVEKNINPGRFYYGLQFTEIDKNEEEGLRQFIYECQREELRKKID